MPVQRTPVAGTYRGRTVVSMPPPSSGGVHLLELLNVLENFPLADYGAGSSQAIHVMTEAMKHAFADRAEWMGDPAFVKMPLAELMSKSYAARVAARISLDHAVPSSKISVLPPAPPEGDQTTHFSIVDAQGNAVANTYTLNFSYGMGMVADGTGVLLNNELDDFAAKSGAPNAFGLTGGAANAPGPGKRPLSSMTPTFVLKDGKLEIVTGSPGGPRIITTVLEQIVDHRRFRAQRRRGDGKRALPSPVDAGRIADGARRLAGCRRGAAGEGTECRGARSDGVRGDDPGRRRPADGRGRYAPARHGGGGVLAALRGAHVFTRSESTLTRTPCMT